MFNEFALDAEALKHVSGGASKGAIDQITSNNNPGGIVDYHFVTLVDIVEDKTDTKKVLEATSDFLQSIKKKRRRSWWSK